MPRRPRIDLAGIPSHIVQRGNDRQACFHGDEDRRDYLSVLRECSTICGVDVHAYVLMDNHVHLLVSSSEAGAASRMMQGVGTAYVRHFNDRHGRTGTLWEGRFHSCPVDSGSYLWNCHRYIELNAVRAGLVEAPEQFGWSSFAFNAFGKPDGLTRPRPEYHALGNTDRERQATYRLMFGSELSAEDLEAVRSHIRHERPWGDTQFTLFIQSKTGVCAAIRPRGRPRNPAPHRQEKLL